MRVRGRVRIEVVFPSQHGDAPEARGRAAQRMGIHPGFRPKPGCRCCTAVDRPLRTPSSQPPRRTGGCLRAGQSSDARLLLILYCGGRGSCRVASWRNAIQSVPGGVRLLLEVTAGAKENRFPDGFNQWRDGRIGIRVKAPAQGGRANEEVIRTLATFFEHPTARIHIEAGATDARKSVRLQGIEPKTARDRLSSILGDENP